MKYDQQIEELLLSNDKPNILLGLQLMKSLNIPYSTEMMKLLALTTADPFDYESIVVNMLSARALHITMYQPDFNHLPNLMKHTTYKRIYLHLHHFVDLSNLPRYMSGDIIISQITSLKGIPKHINGMFRLGGYTQIKLDGYTQIKLDGFPEYIGGKLVIASTHLFDAETMPKFKDYLNSICEIKGDIELW